MGKIIAIVGMAGSGKSIASEYLEKIGYKKIYFGGVIYEKMKEEQMEITPESQKKFREDLRKKYGMGAVAKLLLEKISLLQKTNDIVLDGLYSWEEYKILKEKFDNLIIISIVADKNIRYKRIGSRKDRPFNTNEIKDRDISEIENLAKGGPIAYADYYILNNSNLEDYQNKLEKLLKKIENGSESI